MYSIKEMFYTLQGEGAQTGRVSLFCRFTGCNLWSGREQDRSKAVCQFCDTDFIGCDGINGGKYSLDGLIEKCVNLWEQGTQQNDAAFKNQYPHLHKHKHKHIVLTGGEPLLQVDEALINNLKKAGFFISVETNGTQIPPQGIDHLCVSPKCGSELQVFKGEELKVVFQQNWQASDWQYFESLDFKHFYVQAKDVADKIIFQQNLKQVIEFCHKNPLWRMSIQTHKILGIM